MKKDVLTETSHMAPKNKEQFPLGLDFFSLFVHELKSPLMSLKFKLDRLKSENSSEKSIDSLQLDIQRLFQFIEDGVHTKKLENPLELNQDWALWSDVVKQSLYSLQEWINHKEILVHYEESAPVQSYVDKRWMQVVISNLLINAIQHAPEKSSLWLKTQVNENQELLFYIKDEGPGVSEEMKDKLFHRFQTARPVTSNYVKGTGLGLYIVRSLVEKHKGEVGVQSSSIQSSSRGCTFYIRLPKARPETSQVAS